MSTNKFLKIILSQFQNYSKIQGKPFIEYCKSVYKSIAGLDHIYNKFGFKATTFRKIRTKDYKQNVSFKIYIFLKIQSMKNNYNINQNSLKQNIFSSFRKIYIFKFSHNTNFPF